MQLAAAAAAAAADQASVPAADYTYYGHTSYDHATCDGYTYYDHTYHGQASVPEPAKTKAAALQARVLEAHGCSLGHVRLQARVLEQLARVRSDNELVYYEVSK